jgi:hypothetical protein
MAQYSTSFDDSGYTDGNPPGDWTETWDSGYCTWTIEDESGEPACLGSSYGDMVLKGDNSIGGQDHALTWDDVGDVADVDVKCRMLATYGGTRVTGLVGRCSEDSNGKQGYYLTVDLYYNILYLRKFTDDSPGAVAQYDFDDDMSDVPRWKPTDDVWLWMRLYINGTTLRAKVWLDGDDEPASWQIDTTDSAHASGYVGVYSSYDSYFDWFGVGTGGDGVPSLPAVEADGRITQATVEVLRSGAPEARVTQVVVEVLRRSKGTQPKVIVIG